MSGLRFPQGPGDRGGIARTGEVPQDPALPQLAAALDAAAMRDRFQGQLPGFDGLVIEDCKVHYVRYKPGESCLIGYLLTIREPRGELGQQLLTGKISSRGPEDLTATAPKLRGRPRYGPPYDYLPDIRMVLTAFPNDRSIRGLHRLFSPGKLRRLIERTMPSFEKGLWKIPKDEIEVEVISYKPERRCLVECRFKAYSRATGERSFFALYGRIYEDATGEQVCRAMNALWDLRQARAWPFGLAEPLGYDPESRILFQSRLPGHPLTDLVGGPEGVPLLREVASTLALLHQSGLGIPRRVDLAQELHNFEQLARPAGAVHPPAIQLLPLLSELGRRLPSILKGPQALLHGDFTHEQILIAGTGIALIDFDWTAMGDPAMDIGSFAASIRQLRSDGAVSFQGAEEAEGAFCRAYLDAHPMDDFSKRLEWHRALFLVKRALEAIWTLKPGWQEQANRYLQLAEAELKGGS